MDETTFQGFLKNLHALWDRKMPAETTYLAWWEELRFIPGDALPDIGRALKELETWPRNFPLTVKGLWRDWLAAHPEKRALEQPKCTKCAGGYLLLSKYVETWKTRSDEGYLTWGLNRWYNLAVPCPTCNRGTRSVTELIEQGFCKPIGVVTAPLYDLFPESGWEPPPALDAGSENISEEVLPF